MMQTTVPALVLRRTYDVPRERLWEAWTDPSVAGEFLCPEGVTMGDVQMDVRVGGSYRIVMRPPGEEYIAYGVYREVRRPERLVMTWQWEEDDPADSHETLLTVEFNTCGTGSELVLTHERLASLESRNSHEHGWTSILDKLGGLK